jgi:hypothetical protein
MELAFDGATVKVCISIDLITAMKIGSGLASLASLAGLTKCCKRKAKKPEVAEVRKQESKDLPNNDALIARLMPDIYIARTGSKYHRLVSCSMHGTKYSACARCWPAKIG